MRKRRNKTLLICLLFLPFLTSWASARGAEAFRLASKGLHNELVAPGDWLGVALEYKPYANLREALEKKLGILLKNRGEAHLTLITPPEMKLLLASPAGNHPLTPEKIADMAKAFHVQSSDFKAVCIGQGHKGSEKTYFVVIRSSRAREFREAIFTRAGSPAGFHPDEFYPHITLGYTDRDLHAQDGVIKDEKSCFEKVNSD